MERKNRLVDIYWILIPNENIIPSNLKTETSIKDPSHTQIHGPLLENVPNNFARITSNMILKLHFLNLTNMHKGLIGSSS